MIRGSFLKFWWWNFRCHASCCMSSTSSIFFIGSSYWWLTLNYSCAWSTLKVTLKQYVKEIGKKILSFDDYLGKIPQVRLSRNSSFSTKRWWYRLKIWIIDGILRSSQRSWNWKSIKKKTRRTTNWNQLQSTIQTFQ